MKKALIDTDNRVAQIVEVGSEFEIHPNFRWVDAPDTITTSHFFDGVAFSLITTTNVVKTTIAFNADIRQQIGAIEQKQGRVIRELLLNVPGAQERLVDIEARIVVLRNKLLPGMINT